MSVRNTRSQAGHRATNRGRGSNCLPGERVQIEVVNAFKPVVWVWVLLWAWQKKKEIEQASKDAYRKSSKDADGKTSKDSEEKHP